jgi:hypothetical protein
MIAKPSMLFYIHVPYSCGFKPTAAYKPAPDYKCKTMDVIYIHVPSMCRPIALPLLKGYT